MHSTTQDSLENFPPCSRASFSHLGQHDARGPATLWCPGPHAPSPRGPPVFVWQQRVAAAGLGPLAGYCRRIYCIAACAGCSPAHNRLAVAQGSTLRGKEGGIHPAADCRAFAAVSCRIWTLALDTPSPCSSLAEIPRGTHAAPSSSPPPNFMAGMVLVATWAGGHPACSLSPFAVPEGTEVLQGTPGPPSLGVTAQSWCREGARDCKQH